MIEHKSEYYKIANCQEKICNAQDKLYPIQKEIEIYEKEIKNLNIEYKQRLEKNDVYKKRTRNFVKIRKGV